MLLDNTPASWSERAAAACALEAVGWTREGQQERFDAVLCALQPRAGETLLDYGCGTGALADRMPPGAEYIGFDWAEGMLERAAVEHPNALFSQATPRRADLVACIGTFNLPAHWSKGRTWHTVRHLWDTTGCRALAVSLYAGTDMRCLIYTEAEAEACAASLGFYAEVARPRHNDLLLVARR